MRLSRLTNLVLSGLCLLALASPFYAQDRDFLTTLEADIIRQTQEPNMRLEKYLEFAQERIDQLNQLLAEDRPGRSSLVHDLLEDYQRIIVAIDTVADDSLQRQVDIQKGMESAVFAESAMLTALRQIEDSQPEDLSRYEFVLNDAIITTEDSIELSSDDLGARTDEILARERRQDEAREAIRTPEDIKEDEALKAREEKATKGGRRAPPTLRRPGDPPSTIGTGKGAPGK